MIATSALNRSSSRALCRNPKHRRRCSDGVTAHVQYSHAEELKEPYPSIGIGVGVEVFPKGVELRRQQQRRGRRMKGMKRQWRGFPERAEQWKQLALIGTE